MFDRSTEISYTYVHYIDYPTNTFNALRRCTSLFVDGNVVWGDQKLCKRELPDMSNETNIKQAKEVS